MDTEVNQEKKMLENVLSGKRAVITGGSSGIGLAIAMLLGKEKANLSLIARDEEKLQRAKQKIEAETGASVDIYAGNIKDFDRMKTIIDDIYNKDGLDYFVNNAGTFALQNLDTPYEEIRNMIELIFIAPYGINHYLAQKFRDKPDNPLSVLNVGSQAGLQVMEKNHGYGPGKTGFTRSTFDIEADLERRGVDHITFSEIFPNLVGTEDVLDTMTKDESLKDPMPEIDVAKLSVELLLGKTATNRVRAGYYEGEGIKRTYFKPTSQNFYMPEGTDEVTNKNYTPKDLLKGE